MMHLNCASKTEKVMMYIHDSRLSCDFLIKILRSRVHVLFWWLWLCFRSNILARGRIKTSILYSSYSNYENSEVARLTEMW